jgi:hypothetical protein
LLATALRPAAPYSLPTALDAHFRQVCAALGDDPLSVLIDLVGEHLDQLDGDTASDEGLAVVAAYFGSPPAAGGRGEGAPVTTRISPTAPAVPHPGIPSDCPGGAVA